MTGKAQPIITTSPEGDRVACETFRNIHRQRIHAEKLQRIQKRKDALVKSLVGEMPDDTTIRHLALGLRIGFAAIDTGLSDKKALELAKQELERQL